MMCTVHLVLNADHGFATLVFSVCLSIHQSVTLRDSDYIAWVTVKVITGIIGLESLLLGFQTSAIWSKGNISNFVWNDLQQKTCNISEIGQDRTKVAVNRQLHVCL